VFAAAESSVPGPSDSELPERRQVGYPELRGLIERRARWLDLLVVLATMVLFFVAVDYAKVWIGVFAHPILIFFFAWLLAFLISPPINWLDHHLPRVPRIVSVLAIYIPLFTAIGAGLIFALTKVAQSLADLGASLPKLIAQPPPAIGDLQRWFDSQGISVDLYGVFHSVVGTVVGQAATYASTLVDWLVGNISIATDVLIIVMTSVFIVLDRDKVLRFIIALVPEGREEDARVFQRSVGRAFGGFIRSQVILGVLYAAWAGIVGLVVGLDFAVAAAFVSGAIMMIPIYGPYVSWAPPVVLAALVQPGLVLPLLVLMIIGWLVDENIIAPIVRADAVELHPLAVTAAVLMGAAAGGTLGVLLAVPIAAIISAFFFHLRERSESHHERSRLAARAHLDAEAAPAGVEADLCSATPRD
jgi:predicted PurR-regulated permease PerM